MKHIFLPIQLLYSCFLAAYVPILLEFILRYGFLLVDLDDEEIPLFILYRNSQHVHRAVHTIK
jgi:hypothetical protein